MAYSDNSSFPGVSLNAILTTGPDHTQLSEKTRVAVLEVDGKTGTFVETDREAVLCKLGVRQIALEKVRITKGEQDDEPVPEPVHETGREKEARKDSMRDPWQELDDNEFKDRLETLEIPAIFVKAVFATPWKAHTCGQAYFVESSPGTDTAGKITGVNQFGRSYIFTRHDFKTNMSTNVCINCVPTARASWGTVVGPDMHIFGEYYTDAEAKLEFFIRSYDDYRNLGCETSTATTRQDLDRLEAMKWTAMQNVGSADGLGYRDVDALASAGNCVEVQSMAEKEK
ncbi:hypothetical protein V8F20_008664 [Naviculisporaceae sp. PSN 640]